MTPQELKQRFEKAAQERQRLEPVFNDAIRLTMPNRKRFNEEEIPAYAPEDVYDETGANAVEEFTSRMQAGLFPPFTEFVKLEASEDVNPADRRAVNKDLEEICKFAFEEIWNSNFAVESSESLFDLALSTGLMQVEDSGKDHALHNRAIPITDFYLERDSKDGLGGVYRKRKVKAGDIPKLFDVDPERNGRTYGDATQQADKELEVIEALHRDCFSPVEKAVHYVMVRDHSEILRSKTFTGSGSSPLIPFRWASAAGETWGRGPLLRALAAIRTTNLTVELILENAAMAMIGMYQTDNEGVINADNVTLLPGTIIHKEFGTNGLEPVQLSGGQFNVSDLIISDQRMNIKRALYNDMLSDPNKTPATAFEVAERMADLAYRTSAGFARVFFEFIVPYFRRVLFILQERKSIELPVKQGRALRFVATSPLAQAQQSRKVQRLMEDFQVRAAMFGQAAALASYKSDEIHGWLIEHVGMPEKLYSSPAEFKGALEQAMQQLAAAMQPQGTPQ